MKKTIPEINIDNAATLPKVIRDVLWNNKNYEHRFTHVKFSENIDFYCKPELFDYLEYKIKDGLINDQARKKLTIETITPYLEAFSLGFFEGFNELEQQINSGLFSSDEIKARKIFEYASSWRGGSFPELAGDGKPGRYITKELWQVAGIKAGYHYKAWYIIANNHEPFLKYFEKHEPEEKQKTKLKSFAWNGNQAQKEALCEALKDAGYIEQGTTKEAFTAIFAEERTEEKECNPVKWNGSNRLLAYLFSQMSSGNNPLILSREWQSIIEKSRLFKNKNGKTINAGDLATALNSINDPLTALNPKGYEKIDAILKTLRP